jgi:DNA invertase Pin-like site-specific DNA recombinase
MKAATYRRKSTEDNRDSDASSVKVQRRACEEFIARQGWTLVDSAAYEDDGISGATFPRPGLSAALRDAAAGLFDLVVVTDLDRIGRNRKNTTRTLWEFEDAGVAVWDVEGERHTESADESGDDNDFAAVKTTMRTAQDERERRKAKKRTKRGLDDRGKRGEATVGAPYGFLNMREPGLVAGKPKPARRVPHPEERKVVEEVFAAYAGGASPEAIAEDLNGRMVLGPRDAQRAKRGEVPTGEGWGISTVRAMLKRSVYRGITIHGQTRIKTVKGRDRQVAVPESEWIRVETPETRIVEPEVLALVDARLAATADAYRTARANGTPVNVNAKTSSGYLLSGGAVRCTCGANYEGRRQVGRVGVYVCSESRRRPGHKCSSRVALVMADLDAAVLNAIEDGALSGASLDRLVAVAGKQEDGGREFLAARIATLKTEKARLAKALAKSDDEDLASEFDARVAAIKKAEADLAAIPDTPTSPEALREALAGRVADWRDRLKAEPAVARAAVKALLDPITIAEDPRSGRPDFIPVEVAVSQVVVAEGLIPAVHEYTSGGRA